MNQAIYPDLFIHMAVRILSRFVLIASSVYPEFPSAYYYYYFYF